MGDDITRVPRNYYITSMCGSRLHPQASIRHVKMPRIFSGGPSPGNFDAPKAYALGWEAFVYGGGRRVWGHNGGTDSFGSQVLFVPDLKFGVVVFANTAVSSNVLGDVVAWRLVEERMGSPRMKGGIRNQGLCLTYLT